MRARMWECSRDCLFGVSVGCLWGVCGVPRREDNPDSAGRRPSSRGSDVQHRNCHVKIRCFPEAD